MTAENQFYLIAGIGHSGTKWLSKALHRPIDRMVCYHEEKLNWVRINWKDCLQHEFENGIDNLFDNYFSFINKELGTNRAVGDSNSWTMIIIPEIAKKQKISKIIYLVRNGVQTVHSSYYHSIDMPRDDFLYDNLFRRYWEIIDRPWKSWDKLTVWDLRCFWWRVNMEMPVWLESHLDNVEINIYRLEDLTTNVNQLAGLIRRINNCANLSLDELANIQQIDINRKIQGDRSPEILWNRWSEEQRKIFKEICGPAMEYFQYQFPTGYIT